MVFDGIKEIVDNSRHLELISDRLTDSSAMKPNRLAFSFSLPYKYNRKNINYTTIL